MGNSRYESILRLLDYIYSYPDKCKTSIHRSAKVYHYNNDFKFLEYQYLVEGNRYEGYRITEKGVRYRDILSDLFNMLKNGS